MDGGSPAKKKLPGLNLPGAVGHNENKFLIVYPNHWSQWLPNGFNDILDEPIVEKEFEIPDQPETDPEDSGALIPLSLTPNGTKIDPEQTKEHQYGKIMKNKVCYVKIKKNKLYWNDSDRKCSAVSEDPHNFPPDIVAAIKPKDNHWYFFNKGGKYCKRKDQDYKEVRNIVLSFFETHLFFNLLLI